MPWGPQIYWIERPFDGRLAIVRRPGDVDLERQIAAWRDAGLNLIVSMLEAAEAEELGLGLEELLCRQHGLDFISCPVPDHGLPEDARAVIACVDHVLAALRLGRRVAAHCFAGVGRSPLFVASVLVRHGLKPDEAWAGIMAARRVTVPDTDAQRQWVADLASGRHPDS